MNAAVVAHCRAGFEGECAADLRRLAVSAGVSIKIGETPRRAFIAAAVDSFDARRWERAILDCPPIFARSVFVGSGPHWLPDRDRVTPLLALARSLDPPFSDVWLEVADTNEGKTVSAFCRRVAPLESSSSANQAAGVAARVPTRSGDLARRFACRIVSRSN